jgi:hypothetical protein
MEKDEAEKWKEKQDAKIIKQKKSLEQKHLNEHQALQKKIKVGEMELMKSRTQEMERLLQKYLNVKKGLEAQHQAEINKTDRSNKGLYCFYIFRIDLSRIFFRSWFSATK